MWKLKSCSRCGGDIFIDTDERGTWYEQCLQCSYIHELKDITEFQKLADNGEKDQILKELALVGARNGNGKKKPSY
jgi:hypothetical protein